MVVTINPQRIKGNWISGYALDIHTIRSVHLGINEHGHDVFDTERSDLGELLYQLKYRSKVSAADRIIETVVEFLQRSRSKFDLIVPVPPSGKRRVQPVIVLAQGIGEKLDWPVVECVTTTRSATPLKGVMDSNRRKELLDGLYDVDRTCTQGKSILLFDDLYRSGATMNAVTNLLINQGEAEAVRVLTVTKTRNIQ